MYYKLLGPSQHFQQLKDTDLHLNHLFIFFPLEFTPIYAESTK